MIAKSRNAPKYFHYFLACLLLDCIVLVLVISVCCSLQKVPLLIVLWTVSNFINYPRVVARRFISYYRLLGLSIRQLLTFFILYAIVFFIFNNRTTNALFILNLNETITIFSILFSRLVFVAILRFYRIKGKGYNRFLIIGDTPVMDQLIKGFLAKKSYGNIFEGKLAKMDLEKIQNLIHDKKLNEIYCSSKSVTQNDISKLLAFSFKFGINVHVVSDNSANEKGETLTESIALEYAELNLENYRLIDQKNLIAKRLFDILFSAVIIITVLSWVYIILGIIITFGSKGPIIFKQPRAGRNGKYFMCFKFRSMRQNSGIKQATKNDPRITKVGKFIRKLSIDELPQFVNVLFGQMSVVGPRPHIKDLNDKYDATISNYNDRILVKPGITGLSQITGHRGETTGNESMANRIRIDILYMRSWTMYLDLFIIYKTVVDVLFFRGKGV